ncbi:MAG: hypothetical protein ACK4U0_21660, partial [Mesorhizobium sp.]
LEKLLRAGVELLSERGYEGLSIADRKDHRAGRIIVLDSRCHPADQIDFRDGFAFGRVLTRALHVLRSPHCRTCRGKPSGSFPCMMTFFG